MRVRGLIVATGLVMAATFASAAAGQDEQPSFGRMPEDAFQRSAVGPRGAGDPGDVPGIDMNRVPDFVETIDRDGNLVGYVKKDELFPTARGDTRAFVSPIQPVYASDGKTRVGAMYPGRGFVRAGEQPESVPTVPTTIAYAP